MRTVFVFQAALVLITRLGDDLLGRTGGRAVLQDVDPRLQARLLVALRPVLLVVFALCVGVKLPDQILGPQNN